jgi:hypothetical protein
MRASRFVPGDQAAGTLTKAASTADGGGTGSPNSRRPSMWRRPTAAGFRHTAQGKLWAARPVAAFGVTV